MKDIFKQIVHWKNSGRSFALATVVDTWRSSPRQVGATMIIDDSLSVMGSVSGGCVEGDVIKAAQSVLQDGKAQLLSFGVSNEDAWSAGLSCGGGIKVFVQKFFGYEHPALWDELHDNLQEDKSCVLVTTLEAEPHAFLYTGNPDEVPAGFPTVSSLESTLQKGKSGLISESGISIFLHAFPKKNELLVIGASHISYDLVTMGQAMGFKVTVIDPRGVFTDSLKEICQPEQLLRQWPEDVLQQRTLDSSVYAVMLTHDPKIDDQALAILLPSEVSYIGALGSRKTHARRKERLLDNGFTSEQIDRIHAPVGLDIGASTPAEIALSITAELVKVRNQLSDSV